MNTSISRPAQAVRLIGEVPGADRLLGRTRDDLADAMKCIMMAPTTHDLYNVGCGHDLAIAHLDFAELAAAEIGDDAFDAAIADEEV